MKAGIVDDEPEKAYATVLCFPFSRTATASVERLARPISAALCEICVHPCAGSNRNVSWCVRSSPRRMQPKRALVREFDPAPERTSPAGDEHRAVLGDAPHHRLGPGGRPAR